MRDFLKWLALLLLIAYAQLFTVVWVNAYTFGHNITLYVNRLGEANVEGIVIFGVLWPIVSVGTYYLLEDAGVLMGK